MENTENTNPQDLKPAEPNSNIKPKKSRKLKFIIPIVVILFAITAVFGIVHAQKKFGHGPGGFMIGMIVEKLDLTADQKAQVERIHEEIKAKMDSKKDSREGMMEEFANEFKKANMDKSKLKELDQMREHNMQENKDFMMDKMIEFHNLLTPEQRIKAIDAMKEMKGKFHGHDKEGMHKDKWDREK